MIKASALTALLFFACACVPPKPQKFEALIPPEPVAGNADETTRHKNSPIITVRQDGVIFLNAGKIGTINETAGLETELTKIFEARKKSNETAATTVFVKIPSDIKYGAVEGLIEKLKKIGAAPIGLQIEGLEN